MSNAATPAAQATGADLPLPDVPRAPLLAFWLSAKFWLALVLALNLLVSFLLWRKVDHMKQNLALQSAAASALAQEAQTLSKQAQSLAQDSNARLVLHAARLSELELQRGQLDAALQNLARPQDENLAQDLDAALRLALQQAQLTGAIEPLLAALQSAEQRIERASQSSLARVQAALGRDIKRVKLAAVSDVPGMLGRLDELLRLTDALPLANQVALLHRAASKPALDVKPPSHWQQLLQQVLGEASYLLRISRIESPEAALLSPQQSFFVRENLKLKLQSARLGLLAHQTEGVSADLRAAQQVLKKYFDVRAANSLEALDLLQQLQLQIKQLQIPRIDDTLAALAALSAANGSH